MNDYSTTIPGRVGEERERERRECGTKTSKGRGRRSKKGEKM